MKTYVITDTHLGHQSLVKWGKRPENFTELILKRSALVKGDMLIHLGDICIGDDLYWNEKILTALSGFKKKVLIRGNHESRSNTWYLDNGWDMVVDSMSIRTFGKHLLFSHVPLLRDNQYSYNIHGHLHGDGLSRALGEEDSDHRREDALAVDYNPEWHVDVAPELFGFAPVNLETVLKKLSK